MAPRGIPEQEGKPSGPNHLVDQAATTRQTVEYPEQPPCSLLYFQSSIPLIAFLPVQTEEQLLLLSLENARKKVF